MSRSCFGVAWVTSRAWRGDVSDHVSVACPSCFGRMFRSCLGDVCVMSWSCLGLVSVWYRSCFGSVSVLFLSCLGIVSVLSLSCFGGVSVFFRVAWVMSGSCLGDVSVVSRSCFGRVSGLCWSCLGLGLVLLA